MAIVEGLYPDSVSDRVKELRRQGKLSVALRDLYSKGSRPQRAARPPESPIETKFLAACRKLGAPVLRDLVPQHPVAGYRIDFALPARKIGIELDGFATHSSTADIENDRRRQRDLEGRGWYIIRFGGREVNRDADHCAQQAAWLIEHARKGGAS
jgi:very-short-patch-repair endonuclease